MSSHPQQKRWFRNPSKRRSQSDDRMLKSIAEKAPSYKYRKNLTKIGGIDGMSREFGVCWQCWCRITGEGLNDWRREPFSEMKEHEKVCPLCGYDHWRGRVWYPKRFIMATEIGNPSRRDNKLTLKLFEGKENV